MNSEKKLPLPEDDSSEGDSEVPDYPTPPDGGWGWLIVVSSFFCNVIVDGIIFSFGILLTDLADTFDESKGKTAWAGSLLAGFCLIVGPVVSALANTYGCRAVAILGSFICSTGFIASYFAQSLIHLCWTFGVLGGIGVGFIYLPAIVTVGFYFEQRRAFATGIAVCGSGIGAFIMAPVVQLLLENYGWRGTMLILAGIVLNCSVFASLFRPVEATATKRGNLPKPLLQRIKEARDALQKWDSEESLGGVLLKDSNGTVDINIDTFVHEKTEVLSSGQPDIHDSTGSSNSPTGSTHSPPPPYSEVVGSEEVYTFNVQTAVPQQQQSTNNRDKKDLCNKKQSVDHDDMQRPFYRQDILYSASVINLPEFRSQPDMQHYHASVTRIPAPSTEGPCHKCGCSPAMSDTFLQMLNFSLLSSPSFLVMSIAGSLTLAGFFVPFMYIVDRAVLAGIPKEKATFILSVIGITNTVGRVFCGWLSDKPQVSALVINNCALTIGGIATAFSPFLNSYPLLLVYGGVFGFSIACFAALRSVITVQLLGLENLTNAFGLLLLFQGAASIVGSPVAGLFYDLTGSYDASFYIAGAVIAVSGLMCFPLPMIARWEKSRNGGRTLLVDSSTVETALVTLGASKQNIDEA